MEQILQILKKLSPFLLAFLLVACGGQGGGTEVGNPPTPSQNPGSGTENPPAAPSNSPPPAIGENPCSTPYAPLSQKQNCRPDVNPLDSQSADPQSLNENDTPLPEAPEVDTEAQS